MIKGVYGEALPSHDVTKTDFFAELREELDDYREAINQNTDEIAGNYEYLKQLDRKIDLLAGRIEELALFMGSRLAKIPQKIEPLCEREKQTFMTVYTLVEAQGWVSYSDTAKRLNCTPAKASALIAALLKRGVPIVKRYQAGVTYITIEPTFRELQTKKNVLKITTPLSHWMR